jgi:hypothetical protein
VIRSLHILLIFNILISTYGIPVYEHHCKRLGSQFAFYLIPKSCCSGKKKPCHVIKEITERPSKIACQFTKAPCCKDKTSFIKNKTDAAQGNLNKCIKNFYLVKHIFNSPLLTQSNSIAYNSKKFVPYYDPPPVLKDILLMYRVYRC